MRYLPPQRQPRPGGSWRYPVSITRNSRFRGPLPIYASLSAHALLAALLVAAGIRLQPRLVRSGGEYQIAMVQVAGGSAFQKSSLFVAPNGARTGGKEQPDHKPNVRPKPVKRTVAKASGSGAQAARSQDHGSSSAAGNGSSAQNATFAFPTFSPKPPVADRTLLPASDQQVVLNVKLNEAGEVIDETLVTGLGNELDQMALTTVKTWRFQPATLNGQPIPSEAEVIFTFGPKYPVNG
jgi:TonB family protein